MRRRPATFPIVFILVLLGILAMLWVARNAEAATYVRICESGNARGHTSVTITLTALERRHLDPIASWEPWPSPSYSKHVFDIIPPNAVAPAGVNWQTEPSRAIWNNGCVDPRAPVNDKPAYASPLLPGESETVSTAHASWKGEDVVDADSDCASAPGGFDVTGLYPMGRSVWYSTTTGPTQTYLRVQTDGNWELMQVAQIYDRLADGSRVRVGSCALMTGSDPYAVAQAAVEPNHRYLIQVGGWTWGLYGTITTTIGVS